jgi:ribosomal protein L3 glutamine methyltransferase
VKLIDCIEQQSARLAQAGVCFGHGTDNAFDEAVWLALWRLGLPSDDLDAVAQRELTPAEQSRIEALVEKRIATRKPAAYLTGEAWLQGVPFSIDERAIVPRSLIAELIVDGSLDAWLSERTRSVLDLCTGNGSLAVLAALAWPEVHVDAADLSAGRRYDLIVCNPPYVNSASMAALPAEYRAEPELALAGGADGMDFIRTLLADAAQYMTEQAVLVLEIGHEAAHFEAAFPQLEFAYLPTHETENHVVLVTREQLS